MKKFTLGMIAALCLTPSAFGEDPAGAGNRTGGHYPDPYPRKPA